MKVVKTHPNWKLYQRGYPVAFRFQTNGIMSASHEYHRIITWLKANRGPEAFFEHQDKNDTYRWAVHKGKDKDWRKPAPYFIGLKDETDVSIILLSISNNP